MRVIQAAAVTAVLLGAAAVPAYAQQAGREAPATPAPGLGSGQNQMSDAMVQKVGNALRHVAAIRQQYAPRVQSADSQQQKRDLSAQAEAEMLKAIGDQGLSAQQYDQAIQLAQADPTLRQRLVSAAGQSHD